MDMSISGISGVAGSQPAHGTAGGGDATGALVDRFNRLMETAPPPPSGGNGMPTALTDFVHQQQALYSKAGDMTAAFGRDATSMSMEQMAVRQIELVQAVGQAQMQFTAATAVAQGSKSGLQTLMKNQ